MTTDITKIPSLDKAKPIGLNLSASYWSPAQVGETRRLYYIHVKVINHIDDQTGEVKELPTAVFVDPETKEVIHQGSARLVAVFQREAPDMVTAFQITYKGKQKNSTNQFSSDSWEIYKLEML
jgi:hypothetical protein